MATGIGFTMRFTENNRHLVEMVIEASLRAGEAIMDVYSQRVIEVVAKDDHSPLTIADDLSNGIILGFLTPTGIPVLSEESLKEPWEVRKSWDQCWIVDPLDGTKEFIKRNGEFTVNIALAIHGKPLLGVIFAPATGEIWFGSEGNGAHKTLLPAGIKYPFKPKEVMSQSFRLPLPAAGNGMFTIVASRSHRNMETDAFIAEKEKEQAPVMILSRGSSLKFCMVAEGLARVYPRFAPTMEWDTAAGHAIAVAAGCRVYQPGTYEPLRYNKENLVNPWFIVER